MKPKPHSGSRRVGEGPRMTYGIDYLNRRGARVWVIPLAGTTICRPSMLVPANHGRERLVTDYAGATGLCDRLNHNLRLLGMPGRCFPVFQP